MKIVMLVLPDEQKAYSMMPDMKIAMTIPYDSPQLKQRMASATATSTSFDVVGSDVINGVTCTKYKGTTSDNKTLFLWADASSHIPVKMTDADDSFTILWKNYQAGAQDPSLFQLPPDYRVTGMAAFAPPGSKGPPPVSQ